MMVTKILEWRSPGKKVKRGGSLGERVLIRVHRHGALLLVARHLSRIGGC